MKSQAFRIAFPRKSRLGTIFSIAITLSLLTPLAPAALSAGVAASALPAAPRAAAAALALPAITATKTDAFPDPDNDGKAVPGAAITYTVQITNGGATDAAEVEFNDTVDANTSFVAGSITTTPVAVNDSYDAVGNVRISVPSGPNDLTGNDSDPDGDTLTASAVSPTSANGGEVAVNADGSFTYNPPAGFEGADTFSYTVTDGDGPADTATATINVAGMIWFVDSSAAAGGDGRLTSPFNALTGPGSFDAVAADQQNDNIFLYDGPYAGGLALQSGQALIGEGAGASLATITGLTPPSYSDPLPATGGSDPVVGGASGISIATNNLIRGITIQNTGGTGISGSAFGTLAVADTTVNSTGQALGLDNGKLLASFDAISSTNSGAAGVSLTNIAVNSIFSGGATTVSGAAGVGIFINNVGVGSSLSFGSTDILNRSSTGIELDNVDGSLAFGATTIPNPNGAGGYGINLRNSAAAVTFGSADISDTKLTQAQLDVDQNFIPDNDGNGDAIFLKDNAGSFTLNGGVLSNCDNDCIDARTSSNVALFGVAINNPGVTASGNALASGTGGHGIQAINLSGANSLTSTNISGFNATGRDGLRLVNNAPAAMTMTVNSSTFSNAAAADGAGILISGRDDANMALAVQGGSTFSNLLGAAISHRAGDNLDSTATVNLTVQNSTFQNSAPNGQNTVHAAVLEGGKATVLVSGNTFDNVAQTVADTSGVIDINGDATDAGNSLSVTVTDNVITNIGSASLCGALPCNSRRGIDVFMDDSTNVGGTVVIDGNQLSNMRRTGIIFDVGSGFNGSNIAAKITNNTVGTDAARVGTGNAISAGGEVGINVQNRNSSGRSLNLNLSGNTVRNGSGGAGSTINSVGVLIRDQNSATTDATVTGNDIETLTSNAVAELRVDTLSAAAVLCLDVNGNTLAGGASGVIAINESAGTLNVEQAGAAAVTAANNGAAVTTTGSPQFGVGCAAPPLAMFRRDAGGDYLAALSGPTAKAAQGFGYLSGLRLNGPFELLPGLGGWRANMKTRPGGLSYRYAAGNVALGSSLGDAVVRPARGAAPASRAYAPAAAALAYAGETITLPVGTLPAGKSMTITFQVTINNSVNTPQVSNQGEVSGSNFATVLTDDPETGAFGDPTVTPVFLGTPPDISCPANISVGTDPGVSTASVSFSVSATGTPGPTIDCKVGATSITSPHTFPLGETTVVCTATNGNAPDDSCSFKVTVTDDEAPQVNCPPDITVTLPLNSNATGAAVNFSVTATDNVDPTPTVTTSAASGSVFPVGTTTVTATATDDAGNQSECTFNVTVLYNFAGFFSPVANLPTFNSVKAGQSIPIKFSLSGNKGLNIFAAGYPASGPIPCGSGGEPNTIDETETTGGSGLQYDPSTDRYTYVWKTEKTWKDTCRQLVIQLSDGTFHRANFQFK